MKVVIVKASELGNCWLPRRFVDDGERCPNVWRCQYPERKTCKAVDAEIAYMRQRQAELRSDIVKLDHDIINIKEEYEHRRL